MNKLIYIFIFLGLTLNGQAADSTGVCDVPFVSKIHRGDVLQIPTLITQAKDYYLLMEANSDITLLGGILGCERLYVVYEKDSLWSLLDDKPILRLPVKYRVKVIKKGVKILRF